MVIAIADIADRKDPTSLDSQNHNAATPERTGPRRQGVTQQQIRSGLAAELFTAC
jgi:hypothetical protein